MRRNTMERFWSLVVKDDDDCWLWPGTIKHGYGYFSLDGRQQRVHRLAYEDTYGPVPDGLMVCHRCGVRACCNPAHLYAGTNSDNMLDAVLDETQIHARKTHCPQGHPYEGENLYVAPDGRRHCNLCQRENKRRSRTRLLGEES